MTTHLHRSLYLISGGRLGHPALGDLDHTWRGGDAPSAQDPAVASADEGVAAHLQRCDACRDELAFTRRAGAAARAMTAPPLRGELLERVLAARPATTPDELARGAAAAPPRRPRAALGAVAGLAAAAMVALVVAVPREGSAGAAEGTLSFSVPAAVPGELVRATYEPAAEMGQYDSLMLRARLRDGADQSYSRTRRPVRALAVLRRSGSGAFVGSFRYPDSVVYASLVVESPDASRVDDHGRKQWELLASAPRSSREPSFEALAQRAEDHMGRSWEVALAATREAVRRYPDRDEGWRSLYFFDRQLLGESAADSLRAVYLPRLRASDARMRAAARLTADDMNGQAFSAASLKDSTIEEYWRGRLKREWPASPAGVQARMRDVWATLRADTTVQRQLAEFETMYASVAGVPGAFARQGAPLLGYGLGAALASKDTALVNRWAARYLAVHSGWGDSSYVSRRLVALPALRERELQRLRYFARTVVDANLEHRPLGMTMAAWRTELELRRADLIAAIGQTLVAAGRPAAGADSLERAARARWSVRLFEQASAAWLAAGDTARARLQLARIAVDPSMTSVASDSLARAAGTPADWNAWVAAARAEMRVALLGQGTRRVVRGAPKLGTLDGSTVSLASLTAGRPTVVTFWSRYCGPSLDELPRVEKLSKDLAARGIALVAITDERASKELRAFLADRKLTFPVYVDSRREATAGFNNFGTPSYFILDTQGVVRFDQRDLSTVVRNASLLLPEAQSTN